MTSEAGNPAIRELREADYPRMAALMMQMQAHYRVPCPSHEEIMVGLMRRPAGIEILIAESGEAVLGFASACPLYPGPGLKPGLFLKEIYVAEAARGCGVGRLLMQALARLALERGFQRLDWTADADDPALLRFYDSLGAAPQPKKLFYRLTGSALAEMARDDSPTY